MALQICNNNNVNLPLGHLLISASFLQKSSNNPNTVVQSPTTPNEPQDPDSSQFNSFQFWRSPLPSIENDLLELLVRNPTTSKTLPQSLQTPKNHTFFPSQAADAITVTDKLESVDLSADRQLAESEEHDGSHEDQHEEEEESSDEEEDGDDGGDWITPSNIKQVQKDAGNWGPTADVKVGCVTTDFAMQVLVVIDQTYWKQSIKTCFSQIL